MKIYERNAPTVTEHDDEEAFYPHSDGKPLGESNSHWWSINALTQNVWDILLSRKEDVSVHSDMFWYWERGNRKAVRAPDLMVLFGVPYVFNRLSYRSWNYDNIVPALIIETASREQHRMLLGELKDEYERLGVREYFVFDWSEGYMHESLVGFRLREGQYERIPQNEDGTLFSNELEMNLRAEGYTLRFIYPDTGELLPTPKEREKLAAQKLAEKEAAIALQNAVLMDQKTALVEKDAALVEKDAALVEKDAALVEKDAALVQQQAELVAQANALAAKDAELEKLQKLLQQAGIDASKSSP